MAEKIARLNRTNTARDMYDLDWLLETSSIAAMIEKTIEASCVFENMGLFLWYALSKYF